ncbi:thrombospondin type 1 domain protein [Ancylostoma ceylanicum]|uniref:Thrombospondin type 1 domain protein n=1 Tax=Ancylostoma ceylanicum TaxID=53326 RepID=A0A0D6M4T0_9BILA|nr:thrombospondin type 1 domain protein [Ancylostoma ceylanicum]
MVLMSRRHHVFVVISLHFLLFSLIPSVPAANYSHPESPISPIIPPNPRSNSRARIHKPGTSSQYSIHAANRSSCRFNTAVIPCECLLEVSDNYFLEEDGERIAMFAVGPPDIEIRVPAQHPMLHELNVEIQPKLCVEEKFAINLLYRPAHVLPDEKWAVVATHSAVFHTELFHVIFPCESFANAGFYRIALVNSQDYEIQHEQWIVVNETAAVQLQLRNDSIFPHCTKDFLVRWTTVRCDAAMLNYRLRVLAIPEGSTNHEHRSHYIEEIDIARGQTSLSIPCSQFDIFYVKYCFDLVSVDTNSRRRAGLAPSAILAHVIICGNYSYESCVCVPPPANDAHTLYKANHGRLRSHNKKALLESCEHFCVLYWSTDLSLEQSYSRLLRTAPVVNATWGAWSPWSECSATCGESIQKRYRFCENSDPKRGVDCKGELMETKPCKVPDCLGTELVWFSGSNQEKDFTLRLDRPIFVVLWYKGNDSDLRQRKGFTISYSTRGNTEYTQASGEKPATFTAQRSIGIQLSVQSTPRCARTYFPGDSPPPAHGTSISTTDELEYDYYDGTTIPGSLLAPVSDLLMCEIEIDQIIAQSSLYSKPAETQDVYTQV